MEPEVGQEQDASAPVERPLLAWLAASGPFAVLEALPILEALSGLVTSLHAGGVLHDRLGPEHIAVLEHADGACILSLPEPARTPAGRESAGASEEVDLRELGLLATLLLTGEPPIRDAKGRGPLRPLWYSNPSIPFELGVMIQALVDDASASRPTARDFYDKVTGLRRELEGAQPEPDEPEPPPRRTTTAIFATADLLEKALGDGAKSVPVDPALPFVELLPTAGASHARADAAPKAGRLETRAELAAVQPGAGSASADAAGGTPEAAPRSQPPQRGGPGTPKPKQGGEGEKTDPPGQALAGDGPGLGLGLEAVESAQTELVELGARELSPVPAVPARDAGGAAQARAQAVASERASQESGAPEARASSASVDAPKAAGSAPLPTPAPSTQNAAPSAGIEPDASRAAPRRTPAPDTAAKPKSSGAQAAGGAAPRRTPQPEPKLASAPATATASKAPASTPEPKPAPKLASAPTNAPASKAPASTPEPKSAPKLASAPAASAATASKAPASTPEPKSAPKLASAPAANAATASKSPASTPEPKSAPKLASAPAANAATASKAPASTPAPKPAPKLEGASASAATASKTPASAPEPKSAPRLASAPAASAATASKAPASTPEPKSAPRLASAPSSVAADLKSPAAVRSEPARAKPVVPQSHGESETMLGPRPIEPVAPHPRQLAVKGGRPSGVKLRVGALPGADAAALSARTKTPVAGAPESWEAPTIQMELSEGELEGLLAQPSDALARAIEKRAAAPQKRWKTGVAHPGEIALELPPMVLAGRPEPEPPSEPASDPAVALPVAVSPWLQEPGVTPAERLTARELIQLIPAWVWVVLAIAVAVMLTIWLGTSPMDGAYESDLRGDGPMPKM